MSASSRRSGVFSAARAAAQSARGFVFAAAAAFAVGLRARPDVRTVPLPVVANEEPEGSSPAVAEFTSKAPELIPSFVAEPDGL